MRNKKFRRRPSERIRPRIWWARQSKPGARYFPESFHRLRPEYVNGIFRNAAVLTPYLLAIITLSPPSLVRIERTRRHRIVLYCNTCRNDVSKRRQIESVSLFAWEIKHNIHFSKHLKSHHKYERVITRSFRRLPVRLSRRSKFYLWRKGNSFFTRKTRKLSTGSRFIKASEANSFFRRRFLTNSVA